MRQAFRNAWVDAPWQRWAGGADPLQGLTGGEPAQVQGLEAPESSISRGFELSTISLRADRQS